jgi:uncharacterized protein
MPIARRSTSSADPRPPLAIAFSARALAASAGRAVALDLFADIDTASAAAACRRLPRATTADGENGCLAFDSGALRAAVDRLRDRVSGLVYGAGFEHDPGLLSALASSVTLLGNAPEVVAATKDPLGFAALLARLGAPHPPTAQQAPEEEGWLRKRIGGSGGGHVSPAGRGPAERGFYVQRRVPGRAVSALFLGDGRAARILGHSEQWCAPAAGAPFRYGGCVGPIALGRRLERSIEELCHALTASLGLVGLNSLDLLVEEERFRVLEINPRPGATLDIFDGRDGCSLWRLHVEAALGRLAPIGKLTGAPRAAAVVHAPARLRIPRGMAWPDWTADRSPPGTVIDAEAPVCTVVATAEAPARARRKVAARAQRLIERLAPVPE